MEENVVEGFLGAAFSWCIVRSAGPGNCQKQKPLSNGRLLLSTYGLHRFVQEILGPAPVLPALRSFSDAVYSSPCFTGQLSPSPFMSGPKQWFSDRQPALRRSPVRQRLMSPGSRIRGRLREM